MIDVSRARDSMAWSFSRTVYSAGYFLSYSVVFPFTWVARSVSTDNTLGEGLRDGADRARNLVATITAGAGSATPSAEGAG